jgi:GNAT superfamily N-acetyltransferase
MDALAPTVARPFLESIVRPVLQADDAFMLANGAAARIRPAGPDDAPRIQALVRGLSLESRYRRFFYPLHELAPDLLARFTHADPLHELTLLAVADTPFGEVIAGMAQYVAAPYPQRCEFAVVVDDGWQRNGIAMRLVRNLVCMARAAGIARIEGETLADNEPMRRLLLALEFSLSAHPDGATLRMASKTLAAPSWNCSPLAGLAALAQEEWKLAMLPVARTLPASAGAGMKAV